MHYKCCVMYNYTGINHAEYLERLIYYHRQYTVHAYILYISGDGRLSSDSFIPSNWTYYVNILFCIGQELSLSRCFYYLTPYCYSSQAGAQCTGKCSAPRNKCIKMHYQQSCMHKGFTYSMQIFDVLVWVWVCNSYVHQISLI